MEEEEGDAGGAVSEPPKEAEEEDKRASPSPDFHEEAAPVRTVSAASALSGVVLAWEEVRYSVRPRKAKKRERKEILRGISGCLRPGLLTAVLGPSGCGKSTLLGCLSGRLRGGGGSKTSVVGRFTADGREVEPRKCWRKFALVTQDDALLALQTCRECIAFSARMRLPQRADGTKAVVQATLEDLGLVECADTYVGNAVIKGISGGQRKRVAIGCELITSPPILFLDEPTSGLDSAAAHKVVLLLKDMAARGRSVMATIHQPSSEVFLLFEHTVFLSNGVVVYQGPPRGIRAHFGGLGHLVGVGHNPADFVLFLLHWADATELGGLEKAGGLIAVEACGQQQPGGPAGDLEFADRHQAGFFTQLWVLTRRLFQTSLRDTSDIRVRYLDVMFQLTIYIILFWQAANVGAANWSLQGHVGIVGLVAIDSLLNPAFPTCLTFPLERPIFVREYGAGLYGTFPYFLSKALIEIPLVCVQVLLTMFMLYWTIGFRGSFGWMFLALFLHSNVSSSLGILIGASAKDISTAVDLITPVLIPQLLFVGVMVAVPIIPPWLRWIQWICNLKYVVSILILNEFGATEFDSMPQAREFVYARYNVDEDLRYFYFIMLAVFWVVVRILAYFLLLLKARRMTSA